MNRSFAGSLLVFASLGAVRVASSEPPPTGSPVAATPAAMLPPATSPYNVVLISIDSWRNDMPWNGYPRDVAPRLTAIEKRSISYTHAYSISSFTSKSVGGLLGGTWPSTMKRDGDFFTKYFPANVMLGELLHDAGVTTASGQAHMYLDRGHGFDQGFDAWRVVPGITFDYNKDPFVTSQKLTPLAIEMIGAAEAKHAPFFAWFHFMDPHDVYQPHPGQPQFGGRGRDLYDGEVLFTDGWVGKLVDWIEAQPFAARTVIVITADHGEAFGEKGQWRHAHELYESVVRVPLMVLVPGAAPRHIDTPRSHVDLAPTILELTGAPPSPALPGKSLAGELLRGDSADARPVICDLPEDSFNERRRALIDGTTKLISFGPDFRYELYDLASDPGETKDLFKVDKPRAQVAVARFKELMTQVHEEKVVGGITKHKE